MIKNSLDIIDSMNLCRNNTLIRRNTDKDEHYLNLLESIVSLKSEECNIIVVDKQRPMWTNAPVSLVYEDTDLRPVIEKLAEASSKQIIVLWGTFNKAEVSRAMAYISVNQINARCVVPFKVKEDVECRFFSQFYAITELHGRDYLISYLADTYKDLEMEVQNG